MKADRRFKDYLDEQLKDPEFKKAFDEEEIYASLAIQISKLRAKSDLTQQELARLLGTKQQVISRLEDPVDPQYSLSTLVKLARAFHKKLQINFI